MRKYSSLVLAMIGAMLVPAMAFAEEGNLASKGLVAIGAGLGIGLAALGGGLGQARVISSTLDSIGRNPGSAGKMGLWFFVGLALIESLVILAFVIAIGLSNKM
ncbi:MAG: ATP synthase F0 subunit C [Oligoflexia bacterium]|nr:ATP synthase F0 subunit C [Oligoflexia bacterium]